ncbi:hypothetical protein Rhsp01_32380 [Rhizobium sp. NBRC 114257]|nr:hypothetical protein Rhsp01_32380 [Rhizobium sp. NBRC 114257]
MTQLSAIGLPPSMRLMAGRATAGPVNVSGIAAAAQQTATRTKNFSVGLATFVWGEVIGLPLGLSKEGSGRQSWE